MVNGEIGKRNGSMKDVENLIYQDIPSHAAFRILTENGVMGSTTSTLLFFFV